ncbi:hypothetical protein KKH15_01515 [Patescibacteria group bacterium]|nr:hypothetical protein [Patescibacteria group bacterium]MBU1755320.1 hypothetical protein [Patescibacteria group bacterium]
MPISKALGLGLAILVLKALAPAIMTHIESTAIAFLSGAEVSAHAATNLAASAGSFSLPDSSNRLVLPQAPQIRR